MKAEDAEKMLERIAAQLGEHFEAVQILVSWNEEGMSMCSKRGAGNWYARIGMAREFLVCDQAQTNANEIKQILPPPDDTEDWKEI
jgi:hypothetical protein